MAEKIVTENILKQSTEDILKTVVEHLYDFEEYSDESISNLFSLTPEEVQQISEIINDEVISRYKLWSSQGTSNKINEAKIECNNYADSLIGNISSIQLEWCETELPTEGETNKIYILPVANEGVTVNTLNIWNSETSAYVSIGNLEIDLTQYYNKTEIDNKLDLKANKTEVVSQDDLLTTTTGSTTSNVLSAKTTIDELDKKIDKTSISNTIDENSTYEQIPSSKSVYDKVSNLKTSVEISYADYLALSDEEKNNGVAYYIPDLPVSTSGEIIGDVEYGVFVNSVDTIPLVGDIIPISTKLQGNIKYDNGYMLKNGKTYNINIVVDGYTTSDVTNAHIRYSLNFGSTTLTEGVAIPNRSTSNWGESQVSFVYTPTENGVLTIKCGSIQNISGLVTGFSKVTITEIPNYKGLIDVSDEHIKEVATSLNCSWHTKDISLSSNLTAWGNESIIVSEIINSKKVMLYDGTNQVWTPIFENIGEVMKAIYTNGLGTTDGYNFSQKMIVDFTNGNIMNVSMRTLTSTGNPPNFTKIAYYK